MQRLPGERTTLVIAEGPYADLSVEVQSLDAWVIRQNVIRAVNAFYAAAPDDEFAALTRIYSLFVAEGQPVWLLADHRGPIPPTVDGLYRLPLELAIGFVDLWVSPPSTAVDELVPPGPVRDELNRGLRKAKSEG